MSEILARIKTYRKRKTYYSYYKGLYPVEYKRFIEYKGKKTLNNTIYTLIHLENNQDNLELITYIKDIVYHGYIHLVYLLNENTYKNLYPSDKINRMYPCNMVKIYCILYKQQYPIEYKAYLQEKSMDELHFTLTKMLNLDNDNLDCNNCHSYRSEWNLCKYDKKTRMWLYNPTALPSAYDIHSQKCIFLRSKKGVFLHTIQNGFGGLCRIVDKPLYKKCCTQLATKKNHDYTKDSVFHIKKGSVIEKYIMYMDEDIMTTDYSFGDSNSDLDLC